MYYWLNIAVLLMNVLHLYTIENIEIYVQVYDIDCAKQWYSDVCKLNATLR